MWFFVLILQFSEFGGGGVMQASVEATTERLCNTIRNIAVHQITTPNAIIGECQKATSP